MSQIALIFDVETTGVLPKYLPNLNAADTTKLPYITQISWVQYDVANMRVLSAFDSYIRIPDHVVVPDKVIEITGITAETCKIQGRDIVPVLLQFYHAVISSNTVVGHNIEFDRTMVRIEILRNLARLQTQEPGIANMFRLDWMMFRNIESYCTMLSNIERCGIKRVDKNGREYDKWPTLSELHMHLFRYAPENMHNSLFDVLACLRCFVATAGNYQIPDVKFAVMMRNTAKLAAEHAAFVE